MVLQQKNRIQLLMFTCATLSLVEGQPAISSVDEVKHAGVLREIANSDVMKDSRTAQMLTSLREALDKITYGTSGYLSDNDIDSARGKLNEIQAILKTQVKQDDLDKCFKNLKNKKLIKIKKGELDSRIWDMFKAISAGNSVDRSVSCKNFGKDVLTTLESKHKDLMDACKTLQNSNKNPIIVAVGVGLNGSEASEFIIDLFNRGYFPRVIIFNKYKIDLSEKDPDWKATLQLLENKYREVNRMDLFHNLCKPAADRETNLEKLRTLRKTANDAIDAKEYKLRETLINAGTNEDKINEEVKKFRSKARIDKMTPEEEALRKELNADFSEEDSYVEKMLGQIDLQDCLIIAEGVVQAGFQADSDVNDNAIMRQGLAGVVLNWLNKAKKSRGKDKIAANFKLESETGIDPKFQLTTISLGAPMHSTSENLFYYVPRTPDGAVAIPILGYPVDILVINGFLREFLTSLDIERETGKLFYQLQNTKIYYIFSKDGNGKKMPTEEYIRAAIDASRGSCPGEYEQFLKDFKAKESSLDVDMEIVLPDTVDNNKVYYPEVFETKINERRQPVFYALCIS